MADPARQFFNRLAEQHQPFLESMTGVVRFDIAAGGRTEQWYLQIRKGDVTVSHKGPEPDCVLSADVAAFDAILAGEMNAMAAILRGTLQVQGKVVLLTALQRLFPGTTGAADRPVAGYARRQS
jgi:putative sterol carrier protein